MTQASSTCYRSVADLAAMLAARQISATELLGESVNRIEALDRQINAVVVRDFDRARAAAVEADRMRARGDTRPLLGIPMTVKESFSIPGMLTNWGNPSFAGWMPEDESLVVSRLKAAGAVILGKTNVPFMLADYQTYNGIYGTTNNPWDITRTPGGSSGGSAAALAAGFVPLELGSDMGGSLRIPAHCCGVYAHRPSQELLPMRGSGPPGSPARPDRVDFAVPGPMARSAADLALALEIMAGPDELTDGKGYRLALPPPRHPRLSDYRVLLLDSHPIVPTGAATVRALNNLAEELRGAGCRVDHESLLLPDQAEVARLFRTLLAASMAPLMSEQEFHHIAERAGELDGDDRSLQACWLRGMVLSPREALPLRRDRSKIAQKWREFFGSYDVLLCPNMPTEAFPHDQASDHAARMLDVDGMQIPYFDLGAWMSSATLSGLPVTSAPVARTESSLPIGIQIIGAYLEDRTTIEFARLLEETFGGFRPPGFSELPQASR